MKHSRLPLLVAAVALFCLAAIAGSARILAPVAAAAWLLLTAVSGWRGALRVLLPVLPFAITLALLQWMGGTAQAALALKTLAAVPAVVAAGRLVRWAERLAGVDPAARLYPAALFLLVLRHFTLVLGAQARRQLLTRSFAVRRRYGPGWFTSLGWCSAGVFQRCLGRAERFYAAQWSRGLER